MTHTKSGGGMGSRTPDLLIANETLYQLSYTPTEKSSKKIYQRQPTRQSAIMENRLLGEMKWLPVVVKIELLMQDNTEW